MLASGQRAPPPCATPGIFPDTRHFLSLPCSARYHQPACIWPAFLRNLCFFFFFPPNALGLCLGEGWGRGERTTTQQLLAVVSSWTFERQNQDPRPTLLSGPTPRKLRRERNNSVTFGFLLLFILLLNWRPLGPRETGHSVPSSLIGTVFFFFFLKVPYCGKIKLCV